VLPTEPVERTALLVQFAYFVRELNDEPLADTFRNVDEPSLEAVFAGILGDAERRGEIVQGLDLAREADTLLAISGGLGPDLLLGLRTPEEVISSMSRAHDDRNHAQHGFAGLFVALGGHPIPDLLQSHVPRAQAPEGIRIGAHRRKRRSRS
jgi:hypothetical protein